MLTIYTPIRHCRSVPLGVGIYAVEYVAYVEVFLLLRAAMGGRRVRCSGGSDTLITVTKTKTKINTIELYNNSKKLRKTI